ncbi:homocitrate synthase [Purpureocillium lilacinum]|uniref:Homocitrate synthase n=1 Tax=Purpureocillium lilacinum TaxID=33203 RepID=A0A179HFC6_PURLI|nr:homocitrate synthase [Purpureocillium lilacinum]OAQ88328.1 homocitrate synthase [Purpureocillium lilacinum]
MPLHLLGKKSWNVYNADNIARVRRDEAAAKAAEEAEEQRMQEIDAQRRLAILRGEEPPPLPEREEPNAIVPSSTREAESGYPNTARPRRQRKKPGEDDTDFELRLAREQTEASSANALEQTRNPTSSAPIVDRAGHIDLLGDEKARAHTERNEDAERDARAKRREIEDQYRMRLANAAGKGAVSEPWYSQSDHAAVAAPSKDVWGNEDPRRKERQAQRLIANDPLAIMKQASAKMKELKQQRQKIAEEREKELKQLRKEEKRREKEKRREERVKRGHRRRSEMKTVSDTDHTETGTTVETGMGGTMNGSGTETKTMRAEDLMEIGAIAGMAIAGTLNRSGTESKSTCAAMVLAPPSADRDITETTNDEIPQGVKYAPLN